MLLENTVWSYAHQIRSLIAVSSRIDLNINLCYCCYHCYLLLYCYRSYYSCHSYCCYRNRSHCRYFESNPVRSNCCPASIASVALKVLSGTDKHTANFTPHFVVIAVFTNRAMICDKIIPIGIHRDRITIPIAT